MKTVKSLLTLSILTAFPMLSFASSVDIYGKANLSLQSSDDGDGSYQEIKSNASRIGFKGSNEIDNGLFVVYKAEFGVDMDGDSDKGSSVTDRNQYIGLKGAFGEVLLGNNDSVLKQSQGKVDIFNGYNGDIKSLFKGENRVKDSITYKSPVFNAFQFGMTYITEDEVDAENGLSLAVFYGDKTLKKSNVYAAIAVDNDVKEYDTTRVTLATKLADIKLGGMFQTQKDMSGAKMDGIMLSAKYTLDKVDLKAQVQTADYEDDTSKKGFSLGADYKLASSTKLYAFYTSFDMDNDVDQKYLALGIEYKF